ncbi:MAG: hypothetical protein AAGI90_03525 [Chlamydiota bacterium]
MMSSSKIPDSSSGLQSEILRLAQTFCTERLSLDKQPAINYDKEKQLLVIKNLGEKALAKLNNQHVFNVDDKSPYCLVLHKVKSNTCYVGWFKKPIQTEGKRQIAAKDVSFLDCSGSIPGSSSSNEITSQSAANISFVE